MCGIAGVVGEVSSRERSAVRKMCAALEHRGPDDEGYFDGEQASIGMRRLAIIDVAHGQQPSLGEDDRVAAVLNGEIYNYVELLSDLGGRGHRLRTRSDTECLPHLYEEKGAELVHSLRGMFSFAIWDNEDEVLLLARDRVGKKPLYYCDDGKRLWFASELKALLAVQSLPREVDPFAIHDYLTFQYVPHPRSIIAGIQKLPPAHHLRWHAGKTQISKYWSLSYPPRNMKVGATVQQLAEEVREKILDATRIRLVSERPVGAFLSGGLDSSVVAAAMALQSSGPIKTFSVGFSEDDYNELPFARRVAGLLGTEHHEQIVTPAIDEVLPKIARMFDEPFADSSAVPSYFVAMAARNDVVVVLNGDGGDESFGGYTRYLHYLHAARKRNLPAPAIPGISQLGRLLSKLPPSSRLASLGRLITQRAALSPIERYARMMSFYQPEEKLKLYRPEFAELVSSIDSFEPLERAWDEAGDTDLVNHLLAADVSLYLPGDLLPKVDITTMAVSLEARSPLLDHRLMEFMAGLPGDLKVRGSTTKFLLKEAVGAWLPQDIIHREKMGFGIPLNEWLRGPLQPLVKELLVSDSTRIASYLQPGEIRRLVSGQEAGRNLGSKVWALLMLELWHREVLDG